MEHRLRGIYIFLDICFAFTWERREACINIKWADAGGRQSGCADPAKRVDGNLSFASRRAVESIQENIQQEIKINWGKWESNLMSKSLERADQSERANKMHTIHWAGRSSECRI